MIHGESYRQAQLLVTAAGITNIGSISSKTASMKAKVMSTMQKEERAYSIRDKKQQKEEGELEEGQEMVEDGAQVEVDGDLLVLAVGNGRQAGGGRQLCPQACEPLPTTQPLLSEQCWMMALLDVSYIMNIPLEEIPDVLARMGQTLDSGEMLDCFGSMRVKSLVVDCPDGLQVNRDGEPMRAKRLDFRVLPHRLKVHMAHDELLVQPSRVLKHASNAVHKKVEAANQAERREQRQLWYLALLLPALAHSRTFSLVVRFTEASDDFRRQSSFRQGRVPLSLL
ncbi:hypothetical protein WJX84_009994 [Apatococcus fuscideae]|uniref:Uncharacterized protein n=1 Tax=Apatococcus fuscideae TaxID=2026836 RepID=A0AAW1THB9_9CHLO